MTIGKYLEILKIRRYNIGMILACKEYTSCKFEEIMSEFSLLEKAIPYIECDLKEFKE